MSRSFTSEEFQLPLGNADVDVEIGNIQDVLLHSIQNHTNRSSPSIHMIPSRIRDLNPRVFTPRQVSLGPLHRENKNLQAFERQKPIFLHDLLLHSGLPLEQTLETCVHKVNASIGRIKACYDDEIFKFYKDDEITKMMVMDGCFILEFIYKTSTGSFDKNMVIEPIFMAYDLVLIENQIPFFVLENIFECTSSRFKPITSLHDLIIRGLVPGLVWFFDLKFEIKNNEVFNRTHNHILGFVHEYYRPSDDVKISRYSDLVTTLFADSNKDVKINIQSSDSNKDVEINQSLDVDEVNLQLAVELEKSGVNFIHLAAELEKSGVNFKPHHQPPQWSMDMKLELPSFSWCRPWAKPILRMPILIMHSFTELVFRNLIAYEQLSPDRVLHYITSYVVAMDALIDNHEDVATLVKSKVLINNIGSNEEAAKFINDMHKEIACPHWLYVKEWTEMNRHYKRFWPRNIAWLRRTYFSNPWNIIALLAGIFLFVLTVLQTYFTINPRV